MADSKNIEFEKLVQEKKEILEAKIVLGKEMAHRGLENIAKQIDAGIEKAGQAKDAVIQGVKNAKDAVVDKATKVKDGVVQGVRTAKDAVVDKATKVKDGVKEGVRNGAATVMAAGQITAEAAKRVGKNIKDGTLKVSNKIKGKYKDAKGNLQTRIAAAKEMAKAKLAQVKGKIVDAKDVVVDKATKVKDGVVQGVRTAKDAVVDKATQVRDGVVTGAQAVGRGTVKAVKATRDGVVTGAATVMAAGQITAEAAKRVGKNIKEGTLKVGHKIEGKYKDAKGNLQTRIAAAKEMAKAKLAQVKGKIVDAKDAVVDKATQVKDGVVQGVRTAKDAVVDKATQVRDGVVTGAKAVGNVAKQGAAITVAAGLIAKDGIKKGLEHGQNFVKSAAEVTKDKVEAVRDKVTMRTTSAKMNIKGFFARGAKGIFDRLQESMGKDNAKYMAAQERNEVRKEAKSQDDGFSK